MCTVTNLSAALLLDALHRKDVLSRGRYLHLDRRNSSAAFLLAVLCFWGHLLRSIRPLFCCSPSDVTHQRNPLLLRLLTAPLLSLSLRLLLQEKLRSSQKTLHADRRPPDVRHGGGDHGAGLFPCCF